MIRSVPRQTDLPRDASARDAQRTRALIAIGSLPCVLLNFVAFGNEDQVYGDVAQAEIERRETL